MRSCRKCQGPLRYDREFPGMVCQSCGVVYYSSPPLELFEEETSKRRGGGWHRIPAA